MIQPLIIWPAIFLFRGGEITHAFFLLRQAVSSHSPPIRRPLSHPPPSSFTRSRFSSYAMARITEGLPFRPILCSLQFPFHYGIWPHWRNISGSAQPNSPPDHLFPSFKRSFLFVPLSYAKFVPLLIMERGTRLKLTRCRSLPRGIYECHFFEPQAN